MEDLGRIVIDVNATGGGAAGGGQGSRMMDRIGGAAQVAGGAMTRAGLGMIAGEGAAGAMVSRMLGGMAGAGAAGAAIAGPLIVVAAAGIALKKTFDFLNAAAKKLTDTLRDYSPQIMLADAINDILMMQEKMREGAVGGATLARRELAQGRIERVLFRFEAFLGRFGSIVVTPILEGIANLMEFFEKMLGQFINYVIGFTMRALGKMFEMMRQNPMLMALGIFGGGWVRDMINALNRLGTNTDPGYQGNAPFIADLRLMGVKI